MALRNMLVRVGADISGLKKGLQNAKKDVQFFGRNVTGSLKEIQGSIAGTAAAVGAGFAITKGTQDAMRYEALMTTLGESMGESRKEFEKWQESAGNMFGFSRLQSAETANLLSLNFKQIADSQEDLVKKTTKMMETAAIVANKRGMTMQEVSDRIRSAMNQEADGADELGVNVRVAAIQQSKAYQEMANGAPWDKLSENMRKTILYHHILQQVSERLGSTMQDTTAMRMAQFTASLADVRMALGQAFLPILYAVLPYLNAMAKALYRVLQVVAAFSRSLFGGGFVYKAPKGFADVATKDAKALGGVGEAADTAGKKSEKAAKKAKKAWTGVFGFDEVNAIKEATDSDGAGGGGGGGAGGVGDLGIEKNPLGDSPFKPFEQGLDELAKKMDKYTRPIKDAIKTVYTFVSTYVKEKLSEITAWWNENGTMIVQAMKNVYNFVKPIIEILAKYIWDSITMVVDGVLNVLMGIITFFSGVFTGDWKAAWEGLKDIFFGALEAIWGFLNLTFFGGIKAGLIKVVTSGGKTLWKFVDDIKTFFKSGIDNISAQWWRLLDNIKGVLDDMKRFIDGKVELMQTSFKGFWNIVTNTGKSAVEAIKTAFKTLVSFFARTIVNPIIDEVNRIREAFGKGIGEGFKYVINQALKGFNSALDGFNKLKNATPFASKIPDLRVPYLAKGGITNGPTLAVVGDNVGGREVVSPLDRLQSMLTNSVVQAMQLGGGNNQGGTGDIILNIDGRAFARIVKPFLDKEQNRVGQDVRIRTI